MRGESIQLKKTVDKFLERIEKISFQRMSSQVINNDLYLDVFLSQIEEMQLYKNKTNLKEMIALYSDTISFLRDGNLYLAEETLLKGQKLKSKIVDNIEIKIIRVIELPTVSYFLYKKEQYKEAKELLQEQMKHSMYLESRGIPILVMNRIQQIQNVARIYFKMNRISMACKQINKALHILFATTLISDDKTKVESFLRIKDLMIFQLTTETIKTLKKCCNQDFEKYYSITFKGLNFLTLHAYDECIHLKWFKLRSYFCSGEYHMFILKLDEFLDVAGDNYMEYFKILLNDLKKVFKLEMNRMQTL